MRAKNHRRTLRNAAVSTLCALLLAACGASTDSMVTSAKEYLAKNDRSAAAIQLKNALQKDGKIGEARYLLGTIYFDQGDYASAEKELSRALDAGYAPDDVVPLLAKTLVALGQGDRIATELAGRRLEKPESRAALITLQATNLLNKGKLDEAREQFNAALRESANFPLARVGLARMRALGRDFDGALADIDAILKDSPNLPEAHALRGDMLLVMGRLQDALPAYEAVIAARPTDIAAYQNAVSVLLRLGKTEEAEAKVVQMRKAVGGHPLAVYLQSYIHVRNNKTKEAYDGIQQVLRAAPDYVPALLLATTLQLQRQDYAQAQENALKVLERVPNLPLARRLLVAAYVGSREPARALDALQPLLKDKTEDVSVLSLAGQVYALNGDFTRAEQFFQRASQVDPKNAQVRTRLGVSRLAGGESDQAFQDLEAASAMDVGNIQADVTLIMAHLRRNEVAKALTAVQNLEKKRPNDPVTFNMKGGVLMASNDKAGARKAFERALELRADFLPAVSNLARLDISDKNVDAARKRFETFVTANPKVGQGYMQQAELLAVTGAQNKEVQAVLEKGLAAVPTSASIRSALVSMLIQSGDPKRALLLAQEAQAGSPDEPALLELLARAQIAAGENQQALTTLSKLSSRLPGSPAPLVAMADLQVATKDYTNAEQSLRKAIAIKPDSIEAQQRLISLLLITKRADAAIGVSREVQKQHKDASIGYLLEGEVLANQNKPADAANAYAEAFKRDKSPQSLMRLHSARTAAGQTQEAAKAVADWVRANPKDLVIRTYLAERSLGEQKYDAAIQQYRQMLEIAPKNPMLLNNLAWALGKVNDKSAIGVAEQAVALAPNSPVVLDTLGTLLMDSGNTAKGVETLKKAVGLGPKLPQLRINLARALIKAGDRDGARKELDEAQKGVPEQSPLAAEIAKVRGTL